MTVLSKEWKTVRVSDGSEMRIYVAKPDGKKTPLPGVMVLQEAFGVNGHIRSVTERIAALGYITAAPEFFHRTAPGLEAGYEDFTEVRKHIEAMTDKGLEADLHATYDLLLAEKADKTQIAATGFCMGGRAAFLANAILPLACAVSYYGGGIAERMLPLADKQHGPILLFWGGKDAHIGPKQQYALADALRQAGKDFTDVEFSNANHGFFCDERKNYDPSAASASWALMTHFLEQNFKS